MTHQTQCSDPEWDNLNCFKNFCEEGKGRRRDSAYHKVYELFSQDLCHITQQRGRTWSREILPQRGLCNIIICVSQMQTHFFFNGGKMCLFFFLIDKSSTNKLMWKLEGRSPKRHAREGSLQSPRDSEKTAVGLSLRGSVYITHSWRLYLLGLWPWTAAGTFVLDLSSALVS